MGSNPCAHAFYRKHGFAPDGHSKTASKVRQGRWVRHPDGPQAGGLQPRPTLVRFRRRPIVPPCPGREWRGAAGAGHRLAVPSDDERCRRALRLYCQDGQDHIAYLEKVGADSGRAAQLAESIDRIRERRRRALAKADDLGLNRDQVGARLHWSAILDGAAPPDGPALTPHLMWKMLSGLTHGRRWASVRHLDLDEQAEAADGVVTVMMTGREEELYTALLMCVGLLQRSRVVYDRDRLAWRDRPARPP